MKTLTLHALLATALIAPAVASAQTTPENATAWSFTFENDLFFNTDRYYTDGWQLARKSRDSVPSRRLAGWFDSACRLLQCGTAELHETRDKFGQLMYTPARIDVAAAQPDDRPWAGMLYYARDYELVEEKEQSRTIFTGQVGLIGPYSLVEDTQKWIHKTFNRQPPLGWDNQIKTELGLMAMVERRRGRPALSTKLGSDVQLNTTTTWRVAVGNIMTFAGVGAMIEIGKGLSPTSQSNTPITPKKLPPSVLLQNERTDAARPAAPSTDCLFAWLRCTAALSVEGRWMIRNAFLDGPLFRDGPSVDSRPFVADVVASVRLDFPRTRNAFSGPFFVQFAATRRTPEFRSPTLKVASQKFGALTVGTEF